MKRSLPPPTPLSQRERGEEVSTHMFADFCQYPLQISKYLLVPKSDDQQSSSLNFCGANLVILDCLWGIVNRAIQLNHQLGRGTVEISDVWPKPLLSQETNTLNLAIANCLPQDCFSRRGIFSVLALKFENMPRSPDPSYSSYVLLLLLSKFPLSRCRERGAGGER